MKKLLTTISTITLSLSLLLTPILTSPILASEVNSNQNKSSLSQKSLTSIKPTKVTLNCKTTTLNTGLTTTLTPTILPSNATNKSVTWKSSNTKIATVENGLITAIKAGKSTITVTTVDNKKTAKCIVTVKTAPITTITSISDITQTINQNDDYTLPSTVVAAMSNNTTKQLPIIWNPSDVNTSNSGIYYFYGKVIGWNDDVKLTLTINSTALIVSSIANVSITTTAGTAPILPYQVVATMSDRTTKNVNVTWVAPLTSQYDSVGTFIVNGSIAESTIIKAIANVTVVNQTQTISSIADINKTINQNDIYSLPSTIEAIMSDNSRKQVSVIWSPSDSVVASISSSTIDKNDSNDLMDNLAKEIVIHSSQLSLMADNHIMQSDKLKQQKLDSTVISKVKTKNSISNNTTVSNVNTSNAGTYRFEGIVSGYSRKVKLTLVINAISSVRYFPLLSDVPMPVGVNYKKFTKSSDGSTVFYYYDMNAFDYLTFSQLIRPYGWLYYDMDLDSEGYAIFYFSKGRSLIAIGWVGIDRVICGNIH